MAILEQWAWQTEELHTVVGYFKDVCDKFPDKEAQLFNADLYNGDSNGRMTWSEMKNRVDDIACGLMNLGLGKQDFVAIMSHSTPYWTHADMAISNCGAVSVTIYPTLSIKETSYILNDSKSRFVFVGAGDLVDLILPHFDEIPALEKIIVMDLAYTSSDERVMGLGELIKSGEDYKKRSYDEYLNRQESVTLEDIYTILYTSGTTGQGKGVMLSHWNVATRFSGVSEFFERYGMGLDENDVGLCFLPLSHIFERGSLQMMAIAKGATIAYADKPGTLMADIQKYNPSWFNCVPRLYEKIYMEFQRQLEGSAVKKKLFDWALKVGEQALEYRLDEKGTYNMSPDFDLVGKLPTGLKIKFLLADKLFAKVRALFGSKFKFSFSASAGISADLLKFYYTIGLAVCEGYGSTESFNACMLNPITNCKPGYVGINANGGWARVAPDGELEISGAGVFKTYLNKPEATAESFTGDGWFKTGDLVQVDENGYYKIVDRKKAIICTAIGKNIAPAKIESLFSTSPLVEQIFLIGDERNFISALITPNFAYFIDVFESQGVSYDKDSLLWSDATGIDICMGVGEDFISQPVLKEMIDKEVQKANQSLEHFEQIKQYTIIKDRFSEDNGQLTPTQKAKKRIIEDVYSGEIEKMYQAPKK